MLDKLFSNKLRLKLIMLFLGNPEKLFLAVRLTKLAGTKIANVKRELKNLVKLNIIIEVSSEEVPEMEVVKKKKQTKAKENYYQVNKNFIIYPELRSLVLKSQLLLERNLVHKIEKLSHLKLLVLTGKFLGLLDTPTDILMVGQVKRDQLARLISKYEKELGSEINYTIMTYQEFKYRKDITDRFLYDILENKHLTFVDKI